MIAGNFSGLGINIYDPLTRVPTGSTFTGTQFPGNIIPTNRIDSYAQKLLEYAPRISFEEGIQRFYSWYMDHVRKPLQ